MQYSESGYPESLTVTLALLTASSCGMSSTGFPLCLLFPHSYRLKHISHKMETATFLVGFATFKHIIKLLGGNACCSDFNMGSLQNSRWHLTQFSCRNNHRLCQVKVWILSVLSVIVLIVVLCLVCGQREHSGLSDPLI